MALTDTEIGKRIAAARGEMLQSELAERIGLKGDVLSKIEHGTRKAQLHELVLIARELGVDPGIFLREAEEAFLFRANDVQLNDLGDALDACRQVIRDFRYLHAITSS